MTMRLYLCAVLTLSLLAPAGAQDPGISANPPAEGPAVPTDAGYLAPYEETIPGTGVTFKMTPVPGGVSLLGSPPDEQGRHEDEGPQHRVRVAPMWVGVCEVSWAEYHAFMNLYEPFKKLSNLRYYAASAGEDSPLTKRLQSLPALRRQLAKPEGVDAVTCPTPLYDSSYTYEVGEDATQPAVTMTQYAAKQYTKWLSGVTGRDYRLPTEAEWEHAARAGTTGPYALADAGATLDDYAWYAENSDDRTHPVGGKQPNAWGLHDMHGNVAEWVLDEYDAQHYATLAGKEATARDAVNWPTRLFPRVLRGGSWADDATLLRSAARVQSNDEEWTLSDPNQPISPWWFTEYEAQGIGFRIVRPLQPMDAPTRRRVWDADIEPIRFDVADRLAEGRGVQAQVGKDLPQALEELAGAREQLDDAIAE